jgi:hypothetical protein
VAIHSWRLGRDWDDRDRGVGLVGFSAAVERRCVPKSRLRRSGVSGLCWMRSGVLSMREWETCDQRGGGYLLCLWSLNCLQVASARFIQHKSSSANTNAFHPFACISQPSTFSLPFIFGCFLPTPPCSTFPCPPAPPPPPFPPFPCFPPLFPPCSTTAGRTSVLLLFSSTG